MRRRSDFLKGNEIVICDKYKNYQRTIKILIDDYNCANCADQMWGHVVLLYFLLNHLTSCAIHPPSALIQLDIACVMILVSEWYLHASLSRL